MLFDIIFIRHGETEFNREWRMQGRQDSPLTAEGRAQVLALGRTMAAHLNAIDSWFISPLGRVRETSQILRDCFERESGAIALPQEEVHDRLVEIHCGDFEGRTQQEIDADMLTRIRKSPAMRYPGGENMLEVVDRAREFLDHWKTLIPTPFAGEHRTVVISHGNFIRAMMAAICDLPPEAGIRALLHNAAVCRFIARDQDYFFRMVNWNDRSHTHGGNPFGPV
ncbi:MAG: histidine phosphatase family protein [Leptospiraceae bacterium]|nr:histidine phosphatase family protein [Leptospiraceae bacterium]